MRIVTLAEGCLAGKPDARSHSKTAWHDWYCAGQHGTIAAMQQKQSSASSAKGTGLIPVIHAMTTQLYDPCDAFNGNAVVCMHKLEDFMPLCARSYLYLNIDFTIGKALDFDASQVQPKVASYFVC